MNTVKVAIVGASGYAGEDLVRLVLGHPFADLVAVTSRQYAGQTLAQVFPKYSHYAKAKSLRFTEPSADLVASEEKKVVFLALPHGVAAEYAVPLLQHGASVIDLSADFRLKDPAVYEEFYAHKHPAPELLAKSVYGLAEIYREQIKKANFVACPGCYPTSILLPLIPLLRAKLIKPQSIIADSMSGVTGAGRKVEVDYLFAECNESVRPYGIPKHRHLSELEQEASIAAGTKVTMQFTPHLIPVNRGILTTIYLEPSEKVSDELGKKIAKAFADAYGNEIFIRLLEGKALPDTKNVVGTNFVEIAWRLDPRTGRLIVMSAEDNIVKGTSGQAIQCFNIMNGFPETAGLI
ncbi:MAG TPA: N-acetyl-gamma-glutamyl-phosphate reductase [Candidatus Kapabacteria bacterium]|nr:N-acetyl-gamma-glutamyl-phosphate reductase [Candidatus Kapabacteria bacterium]